MTRTLAEVLDLEVPLTAVLAEKVLTLGQVLALAPGMVVEFEKPVSAPLELRLHERRIAQGRAVRVGENFGFQVVEVADPRSTLQHLGTTNPKSQV